MSDQSVKARLEGVADLVGRDIEPPDVSVFVTRRRARRRIVATVIGAVAIVVAVAVTTALLSPAPRHARSAPAAASAGLLAPNMHPAQGRVSVDDLTHYHWANLPDAPISLRSEGVVGVWTGSRMLIWGGTSPDGQVNADGASYDPASKSWQKLPPSPLGPRTGAAYTWTGDDLFVWGGTATNNDDQPRTDGALYDPAARTWHRLPPVTTGDSGHVVAVWTGSQVVLLTAASGQHVTTVDAHAYNPDNNAWAALPPIHITQTDLLDLSALVAGDRLYVWMPVETISGYGLRTGNDGFVYQPATNTWATTDLLPTQPMYSVGGAIWTGDHIAFQPNGLDCSCGGIPGASTGSWADPRTGAVTAIKTWLPDRYGSPTFAWTGDAILSLGEGHAAAWNPDTAKWTALPRPPYQDGAVQIWTGDKLLIWGQLTALPSSDPGAGSPSRVTEPTGLEFTP